MIVSTKVVIVAQTRNFSLGIPLSLKAGCCTANLRQRGLLKKNSSGYRYSMDEDCSGLSNPREGMTVCRESTETDRFYQNEKGLNGNQG